MPHRSLAPPLCYFLFACSSLYRAGNRIPVFEDFSQGGANAHLDFKALCVFQFAVAILTKASRRKRFVVVTAIVVHRDHALYRSFRHLHRVMKIRLAVRVAILAAGLKHYVAKEHLEGF